jgi:cytochrome c oxidase cbb3-type subunit 3
MSSRCRDVALIALLLALVGCEREQRDLRAEPPSRVVLNAAPESPIQPGGPLPGMGGTNPDDHRAWDVSEGKRLFDWYNCSGCHAHGGGGMGPALMDAEWVYGSGPANVFDSIAHGRPNGMPAWGGRIPEFQIWELVSYVRSMSGLLPETVAPGRSDQMAARPAAQSLEAAPVEPVTQQNK